MKTYLHTFTAPAAPGIRIGANIRTRTTAEYRSHPAVAGLQGKEKRSAIKALYDADKALIEASLPPKPAPAPLPVPTVKAIVGVIERALGNHVGLWAPGVTKLGWSLRIDYRPEPIIIINGALSQEARKHYSTALKTAFLADGIAVDVV